MSFDDIHFFISHTYKGAKGLPLTMKRTLSLRLSLPPSLSHSQAHGDDDDDAPINLFHFHTNIKDETSRRTWKVSDEGLAHWWCGKRAHSRATFE